MLALLATGTQMPRPSQWPHLYLYALRVSVSVYLWSRGSLSVGLRSTRFSRRAPSLVQVWLQERTRSLVQIYNDLRPCLHGLWLLGWGNSIIGHFPTTKYLSRFHHLPTLMCKCYDVVDTRAHFLLECHR